MEEPMLDLSMFAGPGRHGDREWTLMSRPCSFPPPNLELSRQEYWRQLPFPSPGYLPDPGIEPGSPALQADSLPSEPPNITLGILL